MSYIFVFQETPGISSYTVCELPCNYQQRLVQSTAFLALIFPSRSVYSDGR